MNYKRTFQYIFLGFLGLFVLGNETSNWQFKFAGATGTVVLAIVFILVFIAERIRRFFTLQKNISDIAALIFFIALTSTLVVRGCPPGPLRYVGLVGCHLWGLIGAAWAWHRMRVNSIEQPRLRLGYLVIGWAGTLGIAGLLTFLFVLVIVIGAMKEGRPIRSDDSEDLLTAFKYASVLMLFSIPLFLVEYRIRERARKRV